MLKNLVESNVSHIQIHKTGFEEDKAIQKIIPEHKKSQIYWHLSGMSGISAGAL